MMIYKDILAKLKEAGYNTTCLRRENILPQSTITRLRNNDPITTETLGVICHLTGLPVEDLIEYQEEKCERENDMNNTIILMRGFAQLTSNEYKKFKKYDTILGNDSCPEELRRWKLTSEGEAEAKKELAKYRCTYKRINQIFYIEEYALEYCECDEDGDFISGSDMDFAEIIDEVVE